MDDNVEVDVSDRPSAQDAFQPRGYQLEMVEASLKGNIIVAMDTGLGKTAIAVLRIAAEIDRCPQEKRVWFLCPKVALAQQQHRVIQHHLPAVPCKVLVGSDGCDLWSTQKIWDDVLLNTRVIICTPEILYDTLTHGFVKILDIALLVFDEAHYCKTRHPSNRILAQFYHPARLNGLEVPHILGLTASPVFGNEVKGLETIETNLDAICRTPRIHRDELLRYSHRPTLIQQVFEKSKLQSPSILINLEIAFQQLNIFSDPWVKHLQSEGSSRELEFQTIILTGKTNSRDQIRNLIDTVVRIQTELGPWASEWYLFYCIDQFRSKRLDDLFYDDSLDQAEYAYLLEFFRNLDAPPEFSHLRPNAHTVTRKVITLLEILLGEVRSVHIPSEDLSSNHAISKLRGIVFVETRAAACVLAKLLSQYPSVKDVLRLGASFGTSSNSRRKKMMGDCVTNDKSIQDLDLILDDLRSGEKNLLISTNVVEEGIDITACNTIICFDQPPNLVSFVQRRGRARDTKSKYFIMFPEQQVASGVSKWQKLEEEMKKKYMDDMRELERLEKLEIQETGWREYNVESTGARLILDDALSHLHHFCNTLGDVRYASSHPVFMIDHDFENRTFSCQVVLSSCVDISLRRFSSSKYWSTERLAKADAAFEACVALHKAGLLNDNLLPIKFMSEDEASMYEAIEKRPNVVSVAKEFNPWIGVVSSAYAPDSWSRSLVEIQDGTDVICSMWMVMPNRPQSISSFKAYIDTTSALTVSFSNQSTTNMESIPKANSFTKVLLYALFRNRMNLTEDILPILFHPTDDEGMGWKDVDNSSYKASDILELSTAPGDLGLIRDNNGQPWLPLGLEKVIVTDETTDCTSTKVMMKATKMSKRIDFLHFVVSDGKAKKSINTEYLDLHLTSIDSFPHRYSRFAAFVPSIQYKLRNALIAERLNSTILAPVGIVSSGLVLQAISSPAAQEAGNYQRMEFLGDALFKYYTSITIMAQHLNYPEGFLAYTKDLIVSNKSAALAAKETGLEKFIIRTKFTGTKWRPTYVKEVETVPIDVEEDEISTKTLADVVEALIAAAHLDGEDSEAKVLAMLRTFTCSSIRKKIKWESLSSSQHILQDAVPSLKQVPQIVSQLETIIGYRFKHPALAVEALTHPGHVSLSSDTVTGGASYQRLEFLGDAVLDNIVTKLIYSFDESTPVFRMHLLRTASVNRDILGYFALRAGLELDTTDLIPTIASQSKKRNRDSMPADQPRTTPKPSTRWITLPQLLRHSPSVKLSRDLGAMQERCRELDPALRNALENGRSYPWILLASLAPEKLASDLVESVIGAIYIDSNGDLDVCTAWIDKLGVLPWLRRALKENVKVWHPKEEFGVLADTEKVKYHVERDYEDAKVFVCNISVGERMIADGRGPSKRIAEMKAAEIAIEILAKEKVKLAVQPQPVSTTEIDLEETMDDD